MGRHARITEEGKENLLIHSLIQAISIALFQVNWYLLAFPTQHGYTYSRLSVIVSESQAETPQDSASEGVALTHLQEGIPGVSPEICFDFYIAVAGFQRISSCIKYNNEIIIARAQVTLHLNNKLPY